jgi:hypothetical protein
LHLCGEATPLRIEPIGHGEHADWCRGLGCAEGKFAFGPEIRAFELSDETALPLFEAQRPVAAGGRPGSVCSTSARREVLDRIAELQRQQITVVAAGVDQPLVEGDLHAFGTLRRLAVTKLAGAPGRIHLRIAPLRA